MILHSRRRKIDQEINPNADEVYAIQLKLVKKRLFYQRFLVIEDSRNIE